MIYLSIGGELVYDMITSSRCEEVEGVSVS